MLVKTLRLSSAEAVRKLIAEPSSRRVRIRSSRFPTVCPFHRAHTAAGESKTKRLYTLEGATVSPSEEGHAAGSVFGGSPCRAVCHFAAQHLARDHSDVPGHAYGKRNRETMSSAAPCAQAQKGGNRWEQNFVVPGPDNNANLVCRQGLWLFTHGAHHDDNIN